MNKTRTQLYRFAIIGVGNTAFDAAIYITLTRLSSFFADHILLAAFVAFLFAGLNSYFWNKYWTFGDKQKFSHQQLFKFYLMSGAALLVNELVLWSLVQLEINDILAKLIASGFAAGCNFILQRSVVFVELKK